MSLATAVVLPGYEDSDPEHWQSLWCAAHPEYRRILGLDWWQPRRSEWVDALRRAIREVPGPVVVAAHSLGSVTVVRLASDEPPPNLVGALLVAPCDTEQADFPSAIQGFTPMPTARLPFPTILVASRNDPWMRFERAQAFADAWGSELVDAGSAGHVNVAAGFGPWPLGERLLDRFAADWRCYWSITCRLLDRCNRDTLLSRAALRLTA